MDNVNDLQPHEKEMAYVLWDDLQQGVPGAHARLIETPQNVQDAILMALMASIHRRKSEMAANLGVQPEANPFA